MIDLHLHLDGSLSPDLVRRLARMQNIELPADVSSRLSAPVPCGSLDRYLERFALPLSLMQTADSITLCVEDLLARLNRMGLLYAEIRFAPQLHMRQGLLLQEVVEAALCGLRRAVWHGPVRPQLILCLMRGSEDAGQNMETVRAAKRYRKDGVAGIDLAGAEASYPTAGFAAPFQLAKELGLFCTIHAGEASGPESVAAAVRFGADRIGHGIRAASDEGLLETIRKKQILLELCPTSNLQTGAVDSAAAYPLQKLLEAGISVCLNADNMTVSGTDVLREYAFARRNLGLSAAACKQMVRNAAQHAFLPCGERQKLLAALEDEGCPSAIYRG